MTDRSGIFEGTDPCEILSRWLGEASATEPSDPNAMTLATVDKDGLPDARIVLLKDIEGEDLVFFTNYDSAKGQELAANPRAALLFHWKSLGRQIRVRGAVEKVSAAASDRYYHSRPLGSRLGAWASRQSEPLPDRKTLEDRLGRIEAEKGDHPDRPAHWGGYRLRPIQFEFWSNGDFRLHDRFRWSRSTVSAAWTIDRLNP
ncbi:pyridoxamine 5'-phosphate oxidase [Qingshengfaniella alkalisoli]|uniref:Pyridoxine/pyridoxamine 5'-phosphate oxidase n=1 Tax=Qingshengfaniella alkalisoli TaxID=2599296 RepID=A0A5B8I8V8_9RHOB|nr:pyridoxamine 5'-phosphate oxidase [Qingshengfaniella alkalisoli]QDY69236.1 pyridoxamine 5'-phosphate oxidase [Qingshengfaniella alkalisoli]